MKKAFVGILVGIAMASTAMMANAADYAGKRILFIDSYHQGYAWSDGITAGVNATLKDSGADLKVVRMDTKRNNTEDFKVQAAAKVKSIIDEYKPDVVIAADDNASKYLIKPFYKNAALPFVFCGVNWDASVYGYPYKNVTGMVEVSGAKELVELLSQFAKGPKIGVLAEDTLTEHKEVENYKTNLSIDVTPIYVTSFEEWKKKFVELQSQVDMLVFGNTAGMIDFDMEAAKAFAIKNSKIPTGAIQKATVPYAMVGYLKVAEEQGIWAAKSALKILDGTPASDIKIVKNKEGQLVLNMKITQAVGVELPYELMESASEVIE